MTYLTAILHYNFAISTPIKISVIDGIIMGGAVGLVWHGQFVIATEKAVLGIPEVKIAYFANSGISYHITHNPRISRAMARFLCLVTHFPKGEDLVRFGCATHFVHSSKIE